MPRKILFLCVANSARSQMAEGLARRLFPNDDIRSAGSAPTGLNPYAVRVMAELGVDISAQSSTSVADVTGDIDLVITLCKDEVCPAPLMSAPKMHWPLSDPDRKNQDLSDEERLAEFRAIRDQIAARLEILRATLDAPPGPLATEFHASIRVPDLAEGARFYRWLLGVAPKEWTHRYVVFISEKLRTNFVLLVDDGKTLHHDTLYHLGIGVASRGDVIDAHHQARAAGFHIEKPARTTWRGTPLHELWLKDPGGNLIEIYARLTADELSQMPDDMEPIVLCAL